ncbi:hypothetical protein [Gibbsiella quercinecans]|uniref:phosphatase domain-containing protein n=1 Tax=Gibbsiella quercinecans TaxID=929813 RepID=UPI00242E02E8|nr:hypothetical protein [Gibbsiella quercinecans]
MLKDIVVFDLDCTLADNTHRLPYLPTKDLHLTSSWSDFNSRCANDAPILSTIAIMNACYDAGLLVVILTARSDEVIDETENWLSRYGAKYHTMKMRGADDNRRDTDLKEEYLRRVGLDRIIACWDDSPIVVEHLRNMGLQVYHVCAHADMENRQDLKSSGVDLL